MDLEFENKSQDQAAEQQNESSREGYGRTAGSYSYHATGRPHRPRINSQRAYSSDRGSASNTEGGFRPEGFGAGLQSNNERPQRGGYQSRQQGGYNGNRGGYQSRGGYGNSRGGYQSRQQGGYGRNEGGYQPRQQAGGYRPRYNNDDNQGYQPRQQAGGYRPRYTNNIEGGYQSRGGYNNNSRGGYGSPRGGYQSRGGYNNNSRGGYGNPRGGYRPHTADYDPNAKYSMKKRIEYSEANIDPNEPIRLNKFLANAGVCSRREADEFIQAGVVSVNGEVVNELGTKVKRSDEVKFHDQVVSLEKKVYVLLNKPKDYVTTSDDPQQRKTVMDLVKDACPERIYPVGRLDRNTTGVLLLTNDGDLASKLTHPKFLKKKVYHAFLDKPVAAADMQKIAEGIELEDGEIHADAIEYADDRDKSQVGIEIHSGKNRIVRRIFESLGYRVTKLDRVQFVGLTKKNLRRGDWRFLTEQEVEMLRSGMFE
ncbi:MAG: RNA-binding S4 domain-containing protein [Prevotella sp.]|nr:RNA-binding S4 domain-containing protein [Prevotella sp.]